MGLGESAHLLAAPPVWPSTGGAAKRWADSPKPMQPRRQVIFKASRDTEVKQTSPPTTPDKWSMEATGSRLQSWAEEPEDLGHPPELDPHVQEFLSGKGYMAVMGMSQINL